MVSADCYQLYLSEGNQAARSNCSSSLRYRSHATVPHIVALLGFSFHAAKIGIFPLSSKFFAEFSPPEHFIFKVFSIFANGSGRNPD